MAIKHYKPTTNGRRGMSTLQNEEITSSTPTKSLLVSISKTGGRNNQGKMTVRHIGGGAKRVGTMVHCIELQPGKGAEICRSAGAGAQILGREGKYVMLRLQSGETRLILGTCIATIGVVGNEDYKLVNLGKAGRKRHLGIRPTNRGSVMNPNDHPHGGGEGRAPIGRKNPMTPWGKPALGVKTRKSKKKSEKLIVSRKAKK